ncbi:PorP/SprF family type IX secretion system membrane protein [Sediminibacterium ginsengisoli]|uniref:Type IX secretion system membrane protein, PorP/SprF family n=1 Tax=Sediminibacterium ginsengisoli TaxID=413434 RepID=A0A1T4MDC2_9BACT|nr:type IX secretion system membrane protein PorP/SprF [Sediminibacterium ginsengisoli]SJZ64875.1 type IX secretion system membrane protein, PorP/SprF family [Sediminibacterium ginsengisoli]
MNKIIKTGALLLMLVMMLVPETKAQQDVQFSQYIFNPLALNPAYAGYRGATYVNALYRTQWASFPGAPKTAAASVEWLVPNHDERVAWSARVLSDKIGPQQTVSVFGGYTYRIPLNREDTRRLCIGIGAGVSQYTMDGNVFQYVDANDPMVPVGRESKMVPDANFGIYYYTPKFYFSVGGNNILSFDKANVSYNWLGNKFYSMEKSMHIYAGTGVMMNISDNVKFKPSFLWKEDFKGPSNVDLNAFFLLKDIIWLGASYRTGFKIWNKSNLQKDLEQTDAYSLITEIYATPRLRIGYAYDITTSKLNTYQNGTHELSLGITFWNKDKMQLSPRYF